MESYGTELKETPYPLIAALGERELQSKVLQHVRTINEEFVPKLHFTPLPVDHRFPVKKEVREKHGTFPNQTQRDFDGVKVQGILKARWLKKHHELLPAVVLLFHEFDPRWNQKDWLMQEIQMREEMEQLKRGLSGRECRVLLILVQQVDDAGVAPVNVTDERLAGLRKRLETDSKGLLLLRSRDITRGSAVLAKLESSIRNYALEYYKAQSKRVKRYKKALNKTTHQPLHARHSFKIAHYYEFRRYTTKVLQHYEAAYRSIIALPLNESDGIGSSQVKTMAEYVNFKLCYHLIFSSGNIKAAVEQLHRHMHVYARAIGTPDRAYEHWEWVSRQYHVFAQLLSEAVSIRGALPSTGLDSDVYKESYLYYSIAAKYSTYRRKAAARLGLTTSMHVALTAAAANGNSVSLSEKDFVVVPSIFVGGDPVVTEVNASSQEPSLAALVKYRHTLERAVPHAKRTIHLLEHAIQHLSISVADQKAPRSRVKSRLLVQLGTERLAAGDYERSRAELQKAKLAFSMEYWWPQTTQILKQLLICTFRQGDTAAFIDYSLQLLSPILEEFVPGNERSRIQESFLIAWQNPAALGAPFTAQSALAGSHALTLDKTRPMFTLHAQFDRVYACVREDATLELQLHSRFPSPITMQKLEIVFNDERYNTVIYHSSSLGEDDGETVMRNPDDGKLYASLAFLHKATRMLKVPLRVLEGRSMLRYQESRFYLGSTTTPTNDDGDTSWLVLSLPIEQAAPVVRENPKPYLLEGRVPAMGNGSASPSFARRKSMFSTAELGRTASADLHLSVNDGNDVGVLGDAMLEDDLSVLVRGSTIAILQPRAQATLTKTTQHALLTGDFRVLTFDLAANDDTLENLSYRVVCDPPPLSASPDDAFFFQTSPESAANAESALVPVFLDPKSLQPRDWTPLPSQLPQSRYELRVIVRCLRAMPNVRVNVHVAYATKSGVHVSLDERFEFVCRDPFAITSGLVHDYPNGVGASHAKESYAVVGKSVSLQGDIACRAAEPLKILSVALERQDTQLVEVVAASGFSENRRGSEGTEDAVMKEGDMRSVFVQLLPRKKAPFVSVGRVHIQWRRLSSVVPGAQHAVVSSWLDVASVAFIDAPLTLAIRTPSFGVEGAMVVMDVCIRNNENAFHSLRIKPIDEANEFLIAGRTNAVEELLPYTEHVFQIGLVPIKTGYVRLPQLEIVSLTYNMPFTNSDERRELFVLPQECSEWKKVSSSRA
uniref:Trafficking protein particle complex subunit 11 domain-containing protein n=1 Tax=Globisporangium ultimum (strain ATCC 200006 / CBS 805.95 / DAOM BR144) TaxID=431595 RepID=K3WKW3_GLOUD